LHRFGLAVDGVVQAWAREWGVSDPEAGSVHALDGPRYAQAASGAGGACAVGERTQAGAWVRLPEGIEDDLYGDAVDAAGHAPAIAAAAGARAMAALNEALTQLLVRSTPAAAVPPQMPAHASVGHGGAVYRVTLAQHVMEVIVSSSWLCLHGLLGRPARPPVPAWSAAEVLARIPVRLTVELGLACVSVGELSAITADDVVIVHGRSAEPMSVHVDGTDVQLRAFLGSLGAQRAVQFVSATPHTTS
jgi:flagellar motor switch/type III secretory pathway protein FliN